MTVRAARPARRRPQYEWTDDEHAIHRFRQLTWTLLADYVIGTNEGVPTSLQAVSLGQLSRKRSLKFRMMLFCRSRFFRSVGRDAVLDDAMLRQVDWFEIVADMRAVLFEGQTREEFCDAMRAWSAQPTFYLGIRGRRALVIPPSFPNAVTDDKRRAT